MIVAVPAPTIVTAPVDAFTVATPVLFDAYVTAPSPVFVKVSVNALSPYVFSISRLESTSDILYALALLVPSPVLSFAICIFDASRETNGARP